MYRNQRNLSPREVSDSVKGVVNASVLEAVHRNVGLTPWGKADTGVAAAVDETVSWPVLESVSTAIRVGSLHPNLHLFSAEFHQTCRGAS